MESVKVSSVNQIVRNNGEYFYYEHNPATGSNECKKLNFDQNNKATIRLPGPGNRFMDFDKDEIDAMFFAQQN